MSNYTWHSWAGYGQHAQSRVRLTDFFSFFLFLVFFYMTLNFVVDRHVICDNSLGWMSARTDQGRGKYIWLNLQVEWANSIHFSNWSLCWFCRLNKKNGRLVWLPIWTIKLTSQFWFCDFLRPVDWLCQIGANR